MVHNNDNRADCADCCRSRIWDVLEDDKAPKGQENITADGGRVGR